MNIKFDGYHVDVCTNAVVYVKDDDEDEFFEIIESENNYYVFEYYKRCERCFTYVTENYEEMVYERIPGYLKTL